MTVLVRARRAIPASELAWLFGGHSQGWTASDFTLAIGTGPNLVARHDNDYERPFEGPYPARTTVVGNGNQARGLFIEIDCMACVGK